MEIITGKSIQKLISERKPTCDKINEVKDILLFKIIFDKAQGKDQEERFNSAIKQLEGMRQSFEEKKQTFEDICKENENIFGEIKDILSKKEESESDEKIKQITNYLNLNDKDEKNLTIIFKSKKYEMEVKSIIYFFKIFQVENLDLPGNIELSTMKLTQLKETLKELKEKEIYDYKSNSKYYKIFTSIYEKEEALDFLIKKTNSNIDYLKDRLDPTNKRMTLKNIEDTIECLNEFKILVNLNGSQMLDHIKRLDDDDKINKFISYSKNYASIIELDRNEDNFSLNTFKDVDKIIKNAYFIFEEDSEDFYYKENGENKSISMKDLIHIKNQINIQPKKGEDKDERKKDKDKDSFEIKREKLLFFKNIISNLEVIYGKIEILMKKGCCLPISIIIEIKYPKIDYKLNKKPTNFDNIRNFLFEAKNDYEKQLNSIYKKEKYLRFLYGKLFRKIIMYFDGDCEIKELIRYILNMIKSEEDIKDGEINGGGTPEDYVKKYEEYNKKSFENISTFIVSLFMNNKLSLKSHYEKMLIKEKDKYKGFYLKKCDNRLMEEIILNLFLEKLGELPIAQNVLICSKETSIEELQSFLYRAILCEHNTLFVIEVTKFFSVFQLNKMFTYIDKLLSYKVEKTKEENSDKYFEKTKTEDYLSSCLYFIYDNSLELKELEKYSKHKNEKDLSKVRKYFINNKDKEQDDSVNSSTNSSLTL